MAEAEAAVCNNVKYSGSIKELENRIGDDVSSENGDVEILLTKGAACKFTAEGKSEYEKLPCIL